MTKEIFMILLIIHILCDFYFQSQRMADNKKEKVSWLFIHLIVYAAIAAVFMRLVMPGLQLKYILYFILGHAVVDIGKYFICKCRMINKIPVLKQEQNIFIADQLFHVLAILVIVYLLRGMEADALYNPQCNEILAIFEVSETTIISWLIKILLIHKPTNIFISNMLYRYKPMNREEEKLDKNAGRFIGTLERIVMVILISINQYSAVGLVLTAKSIARYDKISKEQEFAEYYLLGTLLSTMCAIVISLIF